MESVIQFLDSPGSMFGYPLIEVLLSIHNYGYQNYFVISKNEQWISINGIMDIQKWKCVINKLN